MSGWIKCSDRLPSLEGKPDWDRGETVIAFQEGYVRPLRYERQMYNKTEKGREPRWVDMRGRITIAPTHWQPLPSPPTE